MAHELQRFSEPDGLRIARISYDILGVIHGGEFTVDVEVERAGRTIQLLTAEMRGPDGRACIRAHAWRLITSDTSDVAACEDETMPALEHCPPLGEFSTIWPGGYIAQLEARQDPRTRPGRGWSWVRSTVPLVEGEEAPFGEFIRDLDAANGLAPRTLPHGGGFAYPNVDLQVHLYREPTGDWKGLDSRATFGSDGIGLTSSTVSDSSGVVGRVEQMLTVRRV
jgi:hypothetical protein